MILSLAVVFLSPVALPAQKPTPQKFNDAIKRSEAAAEVIARLAQLSQNGIPKELVNRAEAMAVFPCKKTDVLVEHAVHCPGVISRRLPGGWSLPAFYKFAGGGFGRPDPALGQSSAVILLFMDKESVDWLSKPLTLEKERETTAGPLGSISPEQKTELAKAHVISYADRKDGLVGVVLKGRFLKMVALGEDNNINEKLYGIEGFDILSGKEISSKSLPDRIPAFQDALKKYWPAR